MSTKLVIADDHELLRDGLARFVMARDATFNVVASVGDAQSAVNACRRHQPDLLILDIEMPGRDALSAVRDVTAVSPKTKIVILTAYCHNIFVDAAARGAAAGYILKCEPIEMIFDSILTVLNNGVAYSEPVRARISKLRSMEDKDIERPSCLNDLTPRELEILSYIGRGLDNIMMARAMSISKRTVERHVSRLMDAVGIRDRASLAALGCKYGSVTETLCN